MRVVQVQVLGAEYVRFCATISSVQFHWRSAAFTSSVLHIFIVSVTLDLEEATERRCDTVPFDRVLFVHFLHHCDVHSLV